MTLSHKTRDNNALIRSGEARLVGWSRNVLYSGFNILPRSVFWLAYLNGRSDITDVITFHARSGWRDARSVYRQTRDMLVQRDSSLAQVREMLVLVRDMSASDRHFHGCTRMQSTDATTTGCNCLARIDMNNRGMRQARAVQSGFKESPSARDNNAMNPSRISRRF